MKIPPYDPKTETLRSWLKRTKDLIDQNPKHRAKINKERAKILQERP